jgi:hypothetical protein
VQSSGLNTITILPRGATGSYTCIGTTLTTAADWTSEYSGFTSMSGLEGYTTQAPSGAVTTLTKDSSPLQIVTTQGQTGNQLVMPAVTTLALGTRFRVVNVQNNTLQVQTTAQTATIATMPALTVYDFTSVATTGTANTTWAATFIGPATIAGATLATGTGSAVLATSPTLVTPNIGAATGTSLATTGALSTSAGAITAVGGSVTARAATTQDGVILTGRAGGTSTFGVTLTPTTLTASRTLTLPDTAGTVVTTGDTGTVTSTMILDGTILNADINASAAIDSTKMTNWENDQVVLSGQIFG